jgi:spermidine/putrescine transport system ATP-binding protein
MTMADVIAVMNRGRIEQLGPPTELYERPRTAFVAGFLGVSNLLEGEVAGHEGGMIAIKLKDGTVIKAPAVDGGQREVRLGIRPEKLRVVHGTDGASGAADLNAVQGTVLDASYIGVSTQYLVETRDGHRMTVFSQNLETAGAAEAIARGESVRLTWQPRHTFVLAGPAEHVAGDPHAPEEEGDTDA